MVGIQLACGHAHSKRPTRTRTIPATATCGWATANTSELVTGVARSILYFDLTGLPSNAVIQQATVRPFVSGYFYQGDSNATMTVTAYRVRRAWPATPNWSNFSDAYAEAYGSDVAGVTWEYLDINVASLVQGWVNGTWSNYGVMLRGPEGGLANVRFFYSSDYAFFWPELAITYLAAGQGQEPVTVTLRAETPSPDLRMRWAAQATAEDSETHYGYREP